MLKVALLGFGFIGKIHAAAYARMPSVQLVGIAGCSESRLQGWKGPYPIPFYPDSETMLDAAGADVVDICLPTFMHEEFVTKAAARGLHVICEKPLALTVEEVDRILTAVNTAKITFMVAQVVRFFPHYEKCRQLVMARTLGDIFFASAARLSEPPGWAQWFRDPKKSGGALFDLQIHDLDYIVDLFGMPESVFTSGLQSQGGCWDHVLNVLFYPRMKVLIESSYRMPRGWPFTSALRLMGTCGSLQYEFRVRGNADAVQRAQQSLVLYPDGEPSQSIEVEDQDPYLAELKYFVDVVYSGEKPSLVPAEAARKVIVVLEAALRSLQANERVSLSHLRSDEHPSGKETIRT